MSNANYLSVEFDEREDEEIVVSDASHLRTENHDLEVESFSRGIGCTTAEVVEDSRGMVYECLDDGTKVGVVQCHYFFISLVHPA